MVALWLEHSTATQLCSPGWRSCLTSVPARLRDALLMSLKDPAVLSTPGRGERGLTGSTNRGGLKPKGRWITEL